jgi:asparagine synthase (glutamine-hydrolysing)
MCGICGKWSSHNVTAEALQEMASEISHRGPDDVGYYINGKIGLANRRLSIIDLSTGKQPISNEDDTVWIVFNGEIYNYPELQRELLERGHQFKTQTDTEVIIHLYEEYGVDCVKKLRGMFAFAIWDNPAQRLFLARDPLGQKPIYYTHQDGNFAFASEIKALLQNVDFHSRMNPRAMHHYISLRYVPGADTLFQGIAKLPAGHILILEHGELTIRAYWDFSYFPKSTEKEEVILQQLRRLLLETVECHLLSDVPIGAFLSGGIDSSLITAMMCELSETPVQTFSIGVREQDFDELPYARMVARRYKTEHHEYIVEPNLIEMLPEMIWHMEEPVDPFAFGVYSVAHLASQHVKVVLGGDGGDEIFAGYDRYSGNQLVDLYSLLPRPLRKHLVEPLIFLLPDNYSYNNRVQKLRWLVAMSETDAGERYAQSASFLRFGHAHKKGIYTKSLWHDLGGADSTLQLLPFYDACNADHPVDRMLYTDVKTRLADHLLMIVDRMTMAQSIEGRSPYVDQSVVEFVARIPANLKLQGRRLKYIQRRLAKDYLPHALINRPKKGFGFPLAYWFKTNLRDFVFSVFSESTLVDEGYFDPQGLLDLLDEHVNGQFDHNYRLWLLLNLELWYRLFIRKTSKEDLTIYLHETLKRTDLKLHV